MRSLVIVTGIAIGLIASPLWAKAPNLAPLTSQLEKIRQSHGINEERDAGPEFTPVKQALREWVEQQLPPAPGAPMPDGITVDLDPADLTTLGTQLSRTLDLAGLTCRQPGPSAYHCGGDPPREENERGFLDAIHIARLDDRYLLVVTGVGMKCGFDQSAYVYEDGPDHRWHLLIAIEQDRYGKGDYRPQSLLSIDISSSDTPWDQPTPPPLVAALGYEPWCSSNWHTLYTKLWQASTSTTTPPALIDREDDMLYMGDDFIAAAHVSNHDLLVEFKGASIDGIALVRRHILHFEIGPNHAVTRVAPVALDPQAFVEEWLTSAWTEASHWSSSSARRPGLERFHAAQGRGNLTGEFDGLPKRCRKSVSEWQVTYDEDTANETRPRYFKVRWLPPYDFNLVAASNKPFPGCDQAVVPQSTLGTLFPAQGWPP
jgi:hypothetical protein